MFAEIRWYCAVSGENLSLLELKIISYKLIFGVLLRVCPLCIVQ